MKRGTKHLPEIEPPDLESLAIALQHDAGFQAKLHEWRQRWGYADPSATPDEIRAAMLRVTNAWHEEAERIDTHLRAMPEAGQLRFFKVESLRPWLQHHEGPGGQILETGFTPDEDLRRIMREHVPPVPQVLSGVVAGIAEWGEVRPELLPYARRPMFTAEYKIIGASDMGVPHVQVTAPLLPEGRDYIRRFLKSEVWRLCGVRPTGGRRRKNTKADVARWANEFDQSLGQLPEPLLTKAWLLRWGEWLAELGVFRDVDDLHERYLVPMLRDGRLSLRNLRAPRRRVRKNAQRKTRRVVR